MQLKIATALATTLAFSAPTFAQDVVVGVPNWPSVTVTANVIKQVVETNMGLKVELQTGTNPVIFEALDKGSMHIHPEVWLPNQQGLVDQFAAKIELNSNSTSAVQGICVNQAALDAGIVDISDLTDPTKAARLDSDGNGKGEVFIGATGWASTTVEKAKAHGYGYDLVVDLVELDEGVAYSQLDTAIAGAKPWAGFCYKPHHLFTVHPEMTFLTEPAYDAAKWNALTPEEDADYLANSNVTMAWPPAFIQPVFAKDIEANAPQVAALMRSMDITADDLGAFSYSVVIDGKDAGAVAAEWITANPDRVAAWLK
jgi:glycine betaine/proline transport system substrate-binding protein